MDLDKKNSENEPQAFSGLEDSLSQIALRENALAPLNQITKDFNMIINLTAESSHFTEVEIAELRRIHDLLLETIGWIHFNSY
jgi:hypothetical protein